MSTEPNQISKSFLTGLMFVNEAYIESSGAGSTGQTELRKEVIEEIRFAKPNLSLSNVYESIVHSISSQIAELEQQKLALSVVRDTLLPKLLSGEIDLSQAADIADEASV
jgi:type I restriction enzyme S subunit